MSLLSNRYGYTGAYGDLPYKGQASDSVPGVVRGISYSTKRKCFHFGFNPSQGLGWAEDNDYDVTADIPWPESQAAVAKLYDEYAQPIIVVFDESSGLPYIINTRDGPTNSKMVKRWQDKYDPNDSTSGTHPTWSLTQREHSGEELDYQIENDQQRVHVRPVKADNRSATGYDTTTGLPTGLEIDAQLTADGDVTADTTIDDIPTNREYVFDHDARGHSLQQKLTFNRTAVRVQRIRSQYTIFDEPLIPAKGQLTEGDYQAEFAAPELWLSRGETLLLDRASGATLSGTVGAITGPDGKSNSAMRLGATLSLGNSAQASGTLILWAESGYTISGVTLTAHSHSGSWYLYYVTNVPANLELPAGDVFDVRIYSGSISSGARGDYYTDVVSHSGRNYLPIW